MVGGVNMETALGQDSLFLSWIFIYEGKVFKLKSSSFFPPLKWLEVASKYKPRSMRFQSLQSRTCNTEYLGEREYESMRDTHHKQREA